MHQDLQLCFKFLNPACQAYSSDESGENRFVIEQKQDPYRTSFNNILKVETTSITNVYKSQRITFV